MSNKKENEMSEDQHPQEDHKKVTLEEAKEIESYLDFLSLIGE